MSNETPKYLLKFVSKEEYAKTFQNGIIYTRPAGYYRYLEEGQGDEYEGNVKPEGFCSPFRNIKMYKCEEYSIYCMYAAYEGDIEYGYINGIEKRCIDDFHAEYVAVIKYDDIIPIISELQAKLECEVCYGTVQYRIFNGHDAFIALFTPSCNNLFIKRPKFSHQNEFRVVFCEKNPYTMQKNDLGGYNMVYDEAKEYTFSYDAKSKIKIYSVDTMGIDTKGKLRLKVDL